jgi:2-keto-3-deoxy-L-rhamnonate aldolase RhmA
MVDAIKHFSEAVAQTDKLAATAMLSRDKLSFFQELNFRVFSCAVDTNLMRNALQELMRRIQSPSK